MKTVTQEIADYVNQIICLLSRQHVL